MPQISFNHIPANIKTPLFFAEANASRAGQGSRRFRVVFVAPNDGANTQLANDAHTQIFSAADAEQKAGLGGTIARMADKFFAHNPGVDVYAYVMTGVQAGSAGNHSITATANAARDGEVTIKLAGQIITIPIAKGTTANNQAAAIGAALSANSHLQRFFTIATAAAVVTITHRAVGIVENMILSQTIGTTINTGSQAGSTTAPNNNPVNLNDLDYDLVLFYDGDSEAGLTAVSNKVNAKWNAASGEFGYAIAVEDGTTSTLTDNTRNNNGDVLRNHPHESFIGIPLNVGESRPAITADIGGVIAKSLANDPARPLQTLALLTPGDSFPALFSNAENDTLLNNNISTLTKSGGTVRIQRLVSTYAENALGVPDNAWYDLNTSFALAYVLTHLRALVTTRFSRVKLADDGQTINAGSATVTPSVVKAAIIGGYRELAAQNIVENNDDFADGLIVQRSTTDPNRLDIVYPADLINALRIVAVSAQFRR